MERIQNLSVETGILSEMNCGNNFSYILNDSSCFSQTEYKVLHSNENSCLAKCMKMLFNEKIQFYYVTNEYKSFASMLYNLDAEGFLVIATNILRSVLDVKNNGFLSCKNIDISFEHIYVEPGTRKVYLIYLPINRGFYIDDSTFENELRTELVKLILGIDVLSTPNTMKFLADLQNGMLSLDDLLARVQVTTSSIQKVEIPKQTYYGRIKLIAMNAQERTVLNVDKECYVIGRSEESADGVITYNKMIGRAHCRILKREDEFFVEDLNSANGTLLNRARLYPNTPCLLANGDILRLANLDFKVLIE